MRILMLTPRFPYPPDRGDRLRSWQVLESLSARHDVWLACVERQAPPPAALQHVRQRCRDVAVFVRSGWRSLLAGVRSALAGRSLTEGYFGDARLSTLLAHWSQAAQFDALFVYSSGLAPFSAHVPAARRILDLCDVDSAKWRIYAHQSIPPLRWSYAVEAARVRKLEARAAQTHDLTLVVNAREQNKLRRIAPHAETAVLPTTVALTAGAHPAVPTDPVVGFVGCMTYPPNVRAVTWFAANVWPQVRAAVPAAKWLIVGGPVAPCIRRLSKLPGVTVTGYVADAHTYLRQMRVFVNPVRGDLGVQSKLLVAMAAGRAAVVTPDAAGGIDHGDPPPFLIARTPAQFTDAVVRLLRDDAHVTHVAARAVQTIASQYTPAAHMRRLETWLAGARPSAVLPRPATLRTPALAEVGEA